MMIQNKLRTSINIISNSLLQRTVILKATQVQAKIQRISIIKMRIRTTTTKCLKVSKITTFYKHQTNKTKRIFF